MLPNILFLNKKDLVTAEYLKEINKTQQDIDLLKIKYNVFDFKVISAKTTARQEFITFLEKFVKKIITGKVSQNK
jgi:hypothetical protein